MAKPRLDIGTYGAISFSTPKRGLVRARTRYRDWDGATRQVQASGPTRATAEKALKAKLVDRSAQQPESNELTPDSTFGALAAYWLDDIDLEGRISRTTRLLYSGTCGCWCCRRSSTSPCGRSASPAVICS